MSGKEKPVLAVHDNDLDTLLKEIDVFDKLVEGKMRCIVCGTIITRENIGFLFLDEDEVELCCDKIECYYEILNSGDIEDEEI